MLKKNGELCGLRVLLRGLREIWKILDEAEDLEDAKARFQALVLDLVLGSS